MAEISGTFDQDSFRFRNDDGSEAAATWLANLNTNATVIIGQTFRLRFLVQETAGGTNSEGFKIQHNLNGAGWVDTTNVSSIARVVASTGLTEGGDTTQQLGGGTFQTDNDGQEDGDGTTPNTAESKANKDIELEFAIQLLDADVDDSDEVQFRVVKSGGGALDTYTRTPTATAAAPTPVYEQNTFRGRNDDGNETTATWKATAGTDWSQPVGAMFRVRFLIKCTDAGETGFQPLLEYRIDTGSGYGAWAEAGLSTPVQRAASSNLTNGADTTQQLGAGTFIANNNGIVEDGLLSTLDTEAAKEWETEYVLVLAAGQVVSGNTVQVKVTKNGADLDTYTDTPTITAISPDVPTGLTLMGVGT